MSMYVPNYDEIIAKIATHNALKQTVHGVGANDVQGANDMSTHAALTASHGVAQIANDADIGTDIGTHSALTQNVHGAGAYDIQASNDVTPTAFGIQNRYVISDDLIHSHDGESTSADGAYTKVKTITLNTLNPSPVTLRIKFDLKMASGDGTAYGRIYKNGVAVGTARNLATYTYITYSEDLEFADGDTLELYCYFSGPNGPTGYKNFRVYGISTALTIKEAIESSNAGEATPFAGTNT